LPTFRVSLSGPSSGVKNSKYFGFSLRNDPEERSSHLLRGGSLKSLEMAYLQSRNIVARLTASKIFFLLELY
jgi:hypothetical protein